MKTMNPGKGIERLPGENRFPVTYEVPLYFCPVISQKTAINEIYFLMTAPGKGHLYS